MKKLLFVPVVLALTSGTALAQSPFRSPFTGIANSFGGGFTASATVTQSVGNIGYAGLAEQTAVVMQNSPNFGNSRRGISGSFLGGFNATANVNQSISGLYNGGRAHQNAMIVQNSPSFTNGAP